MSNLEKYSKPESFEPVTPSQNIKFSLRYLTFLGEECHRKCDKRGHSYPGAGLAHRIPGHAAGRRHDHSGPVQLR